MTGKSVLYISSALIPYSHETSLSIDASEAPKIIYSFGNDVRIFMPKFGIINERRHQLHEVIRLSGINLIINDLYQPLLIKVASIPKSRLQVYFIDNEEYFKRKAIYKDEKGIFFSDNDERAIFFAKGVLEAVKKLNWKPDIIHIYGWFGFLIPLYIKIYYQSDPIFQDSKIIISLYKDSFNGSLNNHIIQKIKFDGINQKYLKYLENPNYNNIMIHSLNFVDAIINYNQNLPDPIQTYIKNNNKIKILNNYPKDKIYLAYNELFDNKI